MAIRKATLDDVNRMVDLSEQKRTQYQEYQPQFWRKAPDSRAQQIPYFENQVQEEDRALLVHEADGELDGFVIANLRRNRACSVDDFALADERHWDTVGQSLLQAVGEVAQQRGIEDYEVVCGYMDEPKRRMLSNFGLTVDRYWYTGTIEQDSLPEDESAIDVREAGALDAPGMGDIAGTTGRSYTEMGREDRIVLVCEREKELLGYAIAAIVPSPPVYDPGGATCLVVESLMAQPEEWAHAGKLLLRQVEETAMQQGAVQLVVICSQEDTAKQEALEALGLGAASEWYVGKI